ncbi:MAG: hypothetical protein RL277_1497 [Planctomycetota bacterium]|jgi:hypothetical protein
MANEHEQQVQEALRALTSDTPLTPCWKFSLKPAPTMRAVVFPHTSKNLFKTEPHAARAR